MLGFIPDIEDETGVLITTGGAIGLGGGTKTGVGFGVAVGRTGGLAWTAITTAFGVAVAEAFVAVDVVVGFTDA
jgi:hypothetical protein